MYLNKTNFFILFIFFSFECSHAQLVANAGINQSVCRPNDSVVLGGFPTALGGASPYTYLWSPSSGMNNPSDANPHTIVTAPVNKFIVKVTDAIGNSVSDTSEITIDSVNYASAGTNQSFCGATTVALGGSTNSKSLIYSWSPSSSLTCSNCPHPGASPTITTTYTLIASDPVNTCSDTTTVTLSPYGPKITTVSPVSLIQGHSIFLQANGGIKYQWHPTSDMFNPDSPTPQVEPTQTYTYYVEGIDNTGCAGYDSVVVKVIGDTDLVFYNTFTPNGDGINDSWFIGNIWEYPDNDLYIYNRYGKVVYYTHGYKNQWDGQNNDQELPAATYYYVLLSGKGSSYKGSVTIIRVK